MYAVKILCYGPQVGPHKIASLAAPGTPVDNVKLALTQNGLIKALTDVTALYKADEQQLENVRSMVEQALDCVAYESRRALQKDFRDILGLDDGA